MKPTGIVAIDETIENVQEILGDGNNVDRIRQILSNPDASDSDIEAGVPADIRIAYRNAIEPSDEALHGLYSGETLDILLEFRNFMLGQIPELNKDNPLKRYFERKDSAPSKKDVVSDLLRRSEETVGVSTWIMSSEYFIPFSRIAIYDENDDLITTFNVNWKSLWNMSYHLLDILQKDVKLARQVSRNGDILPSKSANISAILEDDMEEVNQIIRDIKEGIDMLQFFDSDYSSGS